MPFLGSAFDPTTLTLMYRALDAAWVELVQRGQCKNLGEIRPLMTKRIMAEVALGETNPQRLKILALSAVNVGAITRAEPFAPE